MATTLEEVAEILKALFITALSEYEGFTLLTPTTETPCEKSKLSLKYKYSFGAIKNKEINEILDIQLDMECKQEDSQGEEDSNEIISDTMKLWVDDIYWQADLASKELGDRDNVMHMPKIAERIRQLCYRYA